MKMKQHPLTHLVVDRMVEPIVVALLRRLGLLELVPDVLEELRVLRQSPSHYRYPRCSVLVYPQGGGVAAVHNAERRLPQRRLKGGVEDVLRPGEPTQLVAGAITYQATEVRNDDLVSRLRLPIGLRIERHRHLKLGAAQAHQLAPEIGGEHRVPVGDDRLQNGV